MSNLDKSTHEINLFTFGTDSDNLPELTDIIQKFDEVYKDRGCPQGDAYDQQFDMMMIETAMHFGMIYHDLGEGEIVFSPPIYETDYVLSYMKEYFANQD